MQTQILVFKLVDVAKKKPILFPNSDFILQPRRVCIPEVDLVSHLKRKNANSDFSIETRRGWILEGDLVSKLGFYFATSASLHPRSRSRFTSQKEKRKLRI